MGHRSKNLLLPIPMLFFCGLALLGYGLATETSLSPSPRLWSAALCAALILLAVALFSNIGPLWKRVVPFLEEHTNRIDTLSQRYPGWWILLASGLGLYMELLVIRWHASCFSLFAHFKNVSLISCFLGLGIGYTLGGRRPLTTPLVLPALAVQIFAFYFLKNSQVQHLLLNPVREQFAHGLRLMSVHNQEAILYGFMILVFVFNMLMFIPLGQLASRLMLKKAGLVAYCWNLAGSLLGIAAFSLLSLAWSPPSLWILVGVLWTLLFFIRCKIPMLVSALAGAAALLLLTIPPPPGVLQTYSPYQVLTVFFLKKGPPNLLVNNRYHQRIFDLSAAAQSREDILKRIAQYYELPYLLKPEPGRVLIVGSGTGNDVAAAIRRGARKVDAVEIDPAILYYGKMLHPEKPYQDKRVNPVVEDARSFIRQTPHRYDLIVYGLLDSHTAISGMANTRLDSYVYTVEAFREARSRLKENGLLCMSFSLFSREHGRKLFLMLKEAFDGMEPRVYFTHYDFASTFFIGPGMGRIPAPQEVPFKELTRMYSEDTQQVDLSTDDWPFFYMAKRVYPRSYLYMVIIFIGISLLCIRQMVPGAGEKLSLPCFLLGAGFMLVETKGITELALTFGNTWMVISIVIAGILFMAFLANLVVLTRGAPRAVVTYGLLAASLFAGMLLGPSQLMGLPPGVIKVMVVILLTLPLFFSGMAFSTELAQNTRVPSALSSNLMGAMFGGFLEYNAMFLGFGSLYIMAIVIYGLAFLATRWNR